MIRFLTAAALFLCCSLAFASAGAAETVALWGRLEHSFTSAKQYDNPLYDVRDFHITFTAPSGRALVRNGFWDGGRDWKVRFMPDEVGTWRFISACSDNGNSGLHGIEGSFECRKTDSPHAIYSKGALIRPKGAYHLAFADGDPFFWLGDTAWNGTMKSTTDEWDYYLGKRAGQGYSVIQFVTTQWRGGDRDTAGRQAFEGSGRISIDTDYYKRLDTKIDRINDYGLVAAPVLLWTLQFGSGRELSPGYHLPDNEAILLAKYMVARYGSHHVVWMLGGDGKYIDEYEQRWKNIGRGVFGNGTFGGIVTTHPQGRSWYGNLYDDEDWIDIIGYQSSHSTAQATVEFITKGPASKEWDKLPPRPIMNQEPIYENILPNATVYDVRKAMWWSIFATPVSGVTYGANGIWPWLREGEEILNHRRAPHTRPWRESLDFPGGEQAAILARFMRSLDWTTLCPAQEMLAIQPGDEDYQNFVSVLATGDRDMLLVYAPSKGTVTLFNTMGYDYSAELFDPAAGTYSKHAVANAANRLTVEAGGPEDSVLILKRK